MSEHRWSGWPGAWCLDCGVDDPLETAIAEGCWPFDEEDQYRPCAHPSHQPSKCLHPGEGLADPYRKQIDHGTCNSCGGPMRYNPEKYKGGTYCDNKVCPARQLL